MNFKDFVLGKLVNIYVKSIKLVFLNTTDSLSSNKTHKQKVFTTFGIKLFNRRVKGSNMYQWKFQEYTEVKIHESNKKEKKIKE